MRIDLIEAPAEGGICFIGRAAYARPLTAVSRKDESDGAVFADARAPYTDAEVLGLFCGGIERAAQGLDIGERHDQALSETLAAMPRGGGNAIDFVSIGVFDQRPIV